MKGNTPNRTLIISHWILALSILFLFVSSWWMLALPLPSDEFTYRALPFQLHKNIGISLLLLLVVLFSSGVNSKNGKLLKQPGWIRKLALLDHIVVYFLIVLSCLSGYLSSSFSGWDTSFWWFIDLPAWGEENEALNILFSDIHMWACWLLLAVISVHISAALYHAFLNDGVIERMFRL
jgi:cytochrome b561